VALATAIPHTSPAILETFVTMDDLSTNEQIEVRQHRLTEELPLDAAGRTKSMPDAVALHGAGDLSRVGQVRGGSGSGADRLLSASGRGAHTVSESSPENEAVDGGRMASAVTQGGEQSDRRSLAQSRGSWAQSSMPETCCWPATTWTVMVPMAEADAIPPAAITAARKAQITTLNRIRFMPAGSVARFRPRRNTQSRVVARSALDERWAAVASLENPGRFSRSTGEVAIS
jgi:hypothetical protein